MVIPFNKLHYPRICEWWAAHGWPALPFDALPKTGAVALHEDRPIAAGFLYKTDSTIAVMEFLIADPASDKIVRGEALDNIVQSLVASAKEQGFSTIFTSTVHRGVIERQKKFGFVVTDEGASQLIRRV